MIRGTDILGTATGIAMGTISLLPVAALAVCVLALMRTFAGVPTAPAWRNSMAEVGIVYGTVPWVWMTMLPGDNAGLVSGSVSLEPLADLPTMSEVQVVGNLVLLGALGFFVPLRFRTFASFPRIVVLAGCCSAGIESAQYLLRLDRVSSVDDILLNTSGAALAALFSQPWWRRDNDDERPERGHVGSTNTPEPPVIRLYDDHRGLVAGEHAAGLGDEHVVVTEPAGLEFGVDRDRCVRRTLGRTPRTPAAQHLDARVGMRDQPVRLAFENVTEPTEVTLSHASQLLR